MVFSLLNKHFCSKSLAPVYAELASNILKVNPGILVAQVDATVHKLPNAEISGYPTIKFYKKVG